MEGIILYTQTSLARAISSCLPRVGSPGLFDNPYFGIIEGLCVCWQRSRDCSADKRELYRAAWAAVKVPLTGHPTRSLCIALFTMGSCPFRAPVVVPFRGLREAGAVSVVFCFQLRRAAGLPERLEGRHGGLRSRRCLQGPARQSASSADLGHCTWNRFFFAFPVLPCVLKPPWHHAPWHGTWTTVCL